MVSHKLPPSRHHPAEACTSPWNNNKTDGLGRGVAPAPRYLFTTRETSRFSTPKTIGNSATPINPNHAPDPTSIVNPDHGKNHTPIIAPAAMLVSVSYVPVTPTTAGESPCDFNITTRNRITHAFPGTYFPNWLTK